MPNNASIYTRQLEQVVQREIQRPTPPKDIALYVDHFPNMAIGADKALVNITDTFGEAQIIAGNTSNIPFVETSYDEDLYANCVIAAGCRYSKIELERMNFAAQRGAPGNHEARKVRGIRQALEEKFHLVGCYGSSAHGSCGTF